MVGEVSFETGRLASKAERCFIKMLPRMVFGFWLLWLLRLVSGKDHQQLISIGVSEPPRILWGK